MLGVVQHMTAAVIMLLIVMAITNLQLRVDSMYHDGSYSYFIDPFSEEEEFENSEIFRDMFYNAVRDITTLVVIKGQLETDGVFDGDKSVDCTAFVNRKGFVSECPVTVSYVLDDLIKWGRYGVQVEDWTLSKYDFVTYFGRDILNQENFCLDEEGRLRFIGYRNHAAVGKTDEPYVPAMEQDSTQRQERDTAEQTAESEWNVSVLQTEGILTDDELLQQWYDIYNFNEQEQLVNLVFDYLVRHMDKDVTVITDESGEETVRLSVLVNRYNPVGYHNALTAIADNWIEYCMLENNVIETIEGITYNYEQYQNRNDIYSEGHSNLQYLYRVGEGKDAKYYTNLEQEINVRDEKMVTDYFSNMSKYLIYDMEDMFYESNVSLSDSKVYSILTTYDYAYPDNTRVWVGVNSSYRVNNDQFALARKVYDRVIPYIWQLVGFVGICLAVWFGLWLYLSYTAGRAVNDEGERIHYLNWFDRRFTEFVLALGGVLAFCGLLGMEIMVALADEAVPYISDSSISRGVSGSISYVYGYAMLYGFMASLTFSAMWYSLMRRIKGKNLWKNSFLHYLYSKISNGLNMVVYHRSTAVRTLLPYNLFLFLNLLGLALAYSVRYNGYLAIMVMGGLLAFDAMIGVFLFRRNAEMQEIVEGINKIRQGEVDYQLDTEKLHGENLEMAEAVNNIGEGIRNAVATSVKDERMKTDLITNVSHDIKTPLTSIINYVDLLKRQNIQQEPAKGYIEILEAKAHRLKQLTDDLVEVSRISSGNIELDNQKLNLTELLNQGIGEFSEKFEQKNLTVIFNELEQPAYIYADSRRMWRVIENLFNNICKYAMPSTRVYLDMQYISGLIEISIKNISERQLNIKAEELTERFIRGDVARTTEGSGLGLSITQSLVEAQGGKFRIYLDGDLFKVMIHFPEYKEPKKENREQEKEFGKESEKDLEKNIEKNIEKNLERNLEKEEEQKEASVLSEEQTKK